MGRIDRKPTHHAASYLLISQKENTKMVTAPEFFLRIMIKKHNIHCTQLHINSPLVTKTNNKLDIMVSVMGFSAPNSSNLEM